MAEPKVYLIRHGETEWTLSGRHTGLSDIPLTANGKKQAEALQKRFEGASFDHIFSSPLKRALDTCKTCDLGAPSITDDLLEWDYGDYEGLTTLEIQKQVSGWNLFTGGVPNGESLSDVASRANRLIKKLNKLEGTIALFSSGHFSRVLASQWLEQSPTLGSRLTLSTASVSQFGFEHGYRALLLWNDTSHLN